MVFNSGVNIMMEMTVKEMQQVSGGGGPSGGVNGDKSGGLGSATPLGGRGGIGGEVRMLLGDDSASGVGASARALGGRGGLGGEV
jgi:bacteriocin-like protein